MTEGSRYTLAILVSIVVHGLMAYLEQDIDPSKACLPGFMILIRMNEAVDPSESDTLAIHS